MKFTAAILALIAVASAGSIEQKSAVAYTYEDIREQELKCKADRNREWKYDAATNTWACPLQRYDWAIRSSRMTWRTKFTKAEKWWYSNRSDRATDCFHLLLMTFLFVPVIVHWLFEPWANSWPRTWKWTVSSRMCRCFTHSHILPQKKQVAACLVLHC